MSGCHKSKVCFQSWGVYFSGRVHLSMHKSLGLVSRITHKKFKYRYVGTVSSILKTRRRPPYYPPSASIFQISIFQNFLSHPTPGTSIPCFRYEVGGGEASIRFPQTDFDLWAITEAEINKRKIIPNSTSRLCIYNHACRSILKHQKGGDVRVLPVSPANCVYMLTGFLRDNYLITSSLIFSIFPT